MLTMAADTRAQGINLQRKINVPSEEIRFDSLLHLVNRQAGIRYSLNTRKFPPSRIIRVKKGTQALLQLLQDIQVHTGIYYTLLGTHIIFIDNPPRKIPLPATVPQASAPPVRQVTPVLKKIPAVPFPRLIPLPPPPAGIRADATDTLFCLTDTIRYIAVKHDSVLLHPVPDTSRRGWLPPVDTPFRKLSFTMGTYTPYYRIGVRDTRYYKERNTIQLPVIQLPQLHWPSFSGFYLWGRDTTYDRYYQQLKLMRANLLLSEAIRQQQVLAAQTAAGLQPVSQPVTVADNKPIAGLPATEAKPVAAPSFTSRISALFHNKGTYHSYSAAGPRPRFLDMKPFVGIGAVADETFLFNTTLRAGLPFIYGIASLSSTTLDIYILRYGGGTSLSIRNDLRVHLTLTTGTEDHNAFYYPYQQVNLISKIHKLSILGEKKLSRHFAVHAGITLNDHQIVFTRYSEGIPGYSKATIYDIFRIAHPRYAFFETSFSNGYVSNTFWAGIQAGIFYNLNF